MCFKCKLCRRTLDSTLHCDGPDREIYCRGIFHLERIYDNSWHCRSMECLAILRIDIRTDCPVFRHVGRSSPPGRVCLSVYFCLPPFIFVRSLPDRLVSHYCRPLKPVLRTLFLYRQKTAPERTGVAKCREGSTTSVDRSVTFPCRTIITVVRDARMFVYSLQDT